MLLPVVLMALAASYCSAAPQYLYQHHQPLIVATGPPPHPRVLENDAMEALLPDHLRNDFYKDPRIVAALAEPSWFGYKEGQVTHRDTDLIPREKIFHILRNAGFIHR